MFSKKEYYKSNDEYYKSDSSYYKSNEEYYKSNQEYYKSAGQEDDLAKNKSENNEEEQLTSNEGS